MGETDNESQDTDRLIKNNESSFSPTFFVGMVIYLIVIVISGFWPTYFGPFFSGEEVGHPKSLIENTSILHVHGLVMLSWMGLILFQTIYIARDKTHTHVRRGYYVAAFGIVVFLSGLLIIYVQGQSFVQEGVLTWSQVPMLSLSSEIEMAQFAILLFLGYRFRKKPAAHKRYMLFATMVLTTAATSRMGYLFGSWSAHIMAVAQVAPVIAYDFYKKRRIHSATLIGTVIFSLFFIIKALIE